MEQESWQGDNRGRRAGRYRGDLLCMAYFFPQNVERETEGDTIERGKDVSGSVLQ